MEESIQRTRYKFIGRVQNRGFRFACMVCAERSDVTGWVRNERDGSVTAEVQGGAEQQLAFIQKLTTLVHGHGDGWSVGKESSIAPIADEKGFSIRRW